MPDCAAFWSGMIGYSAFVDEAGSEGDPDKVGGFEFIILSAAVFRHTNLQFATEIWLDAAKRLRKKPDHFDRDFKKFNSDREKYLITSMLSRVPFRFATVIVHKPSLTQLGAKYGDIYHYASQLLLERISWICRDADLNCHETDPRCSILFSERKSLRADRFIDYAKPILANEHKRSSRVEAKHIDLDLISDRPHRDCPPLRVADFIAASFGAALETNKLLGMTDDRFIVNLMPTAYRPKERKIWSNGIKLFPPEAETETTLLDEDRFRWAKTHCK